jgi:amino acid transporter
MPHHSVNLSSEQRPTQTSYVRKSSGLIRSISGPAAMLGNVIGMGVFINLYYLPGASALYPNASLPLTVVLGLLLTLAIASVYWLLSTAMPRTGGDYVYVSRIFHPSIGFMANLMFVVIVTTWVGFFPPLAGSQGIATMLSNLAIATGNSGYLSNVAWFTSAFGQFVVGAIIIAIAIGIVMLPVKWIFRTLVAIFLTQIVIVAWFALVMATASHSSFVANFNANFGTANAYNSILQSASKVTGSLTYPITLGATAIGMVYTMLSYIGYANSSYFAGELRGSPKSAQGLAIMISPMIFAVVIFLEYQLSYNVFGHDFLVASGTLATTANAAWTASVLPTPAYLIAYVSTNTAFLVAVPFGLMLTMTGFAIVYMFVPIRQLFAYAFDRIVPTRFASVDRRGVPWAAVLLFGFIAYVSLYLALYTPVFTDLGYTNFGWWLAAAIVMFAGAAFPFVKRTKDVYNNAPSIVRTKIGSLPVITLIGVVAGALSLFVSYSAILPSFTGAKFNPLYAIDILLVFVVALLIYAISHFYHKAKGMPLEMAMTELPPT